VLTLTRRLVPVLLAGLLILPLAGPAAATDSFPPEPVTGAVLIQSGLDLVLMTNRQRAAVGLVALRVDPDLMAIARDRAEVMAANETMSHTEPNGQKVFDRLNAAGLTWYGAGEIIAWNNYPTEGLSVALAIQSWMASPGHHDIMVSTDYNYVGYGAAVSASGSRYYAGVFVKEPDETAPYANLPTVAKHSVDASHVRVTIRWSGADARLQVLTSGLRYFQVQRRRTGGAWASWAVTTATSRTLTWTRGHDRQIRVRARDNAGNWGPWRTVNVNL
jgi:uncharacterized protein YkwD